MDQSVANPSTVVDDGTVAHSLLGASHTILGYAAGLESRALDERDRHAIAAILVSARRISSIAEAMSLLQHATRSEGDGTRVRTAGTAGVEAADTGRSLDTLITEAVNRLRSGFTMRGVDLSLSPAAGSAELEMSVRATNAILDLMLVWAVTRAAPRTAVRVETSTRFDTAVVSVDVGRATSADDAWTIAAELAAACGSQLQLDATTGCGKLVARIASVETAGDAACKSFAAGVGAPVQASVHAASDLLRVLYADDDAAGRDLVAFALANDPRCELTVAESAEQARNSLCQSAFDVVLMDAHLGDGSGIDVLASASPSMPDGCSMYLLTGDRDTTLLERANRLGAYVLYKPLDLDRLRETIERRSR